MRRNKRGNPSAQANAAADRPLAVGERRRAEPRARVYIEEISVPFSYPVYFTRRALSADNPVLADVAKRPGEAPARVLAYLDDGLVAAHPYLPDALPAYARRHADAIDLVAPPRVLPGGEKAKDGWSVAGRVLDDIAAHRLCRHSAVVVAGGGAFLDAVGLGASLVHRGVRLIRMPSTTLSQDDGGVGVKTGINLGGVKNLVGTFAPPFAVVNDLDFLATLPREVMLDGVAEAFKVAIIKDPDFFAFLCEAAERLRDGEPAALEHAVRRSAELHLAHIREGRDPFEMGDARPLDFGHWAAHRLEALSGYALRHGQAVAVGIALDAYYAWRTGRLARGELERILEAFARAGLPTWHPLLAARDEAGALRVLEGVEQFREHLGGRLSVTLPQGIGHRVEVHAIEPSLVGEGIRFLQERQQRR
ncbi:MAG: 3-dehydroquinate synthase [Candidatus Brocadiia bacterium]